MQYAITETKFGLNKAHLGLDIKVMNFTFVTNCYAVFCRKKLNISKSVTYFDKT